MNVPAWALSNLCIGRSYDANDNKAGLDIFHPDIPIKTENVNMFSFRYKIVKSNEDVRDLLNISGDISLKIKANIFKVEGAGKYISNNNNEEGTTEVLAVMKCTTVSSSHCQTWTWCTQCSSSMHGQREKSRIKGHLQLFCHETALFIIMLNTITIILLSLAEFWAILHPCLLISGDISSDFAGWLLIILPY